MGSFYCVGHEHHPSTTNQQSNLPLCLASLIVRRRRSRTSSERAETTRAPGTIKIRDPVLAVIPQTTHTVAVARLARIPMAATMMIRIVAPARQIRVMRTRATQAPATVAATLLDLLAAVATTTIWALAPVGATLLGLLAAVATTTIRALAPVGATLLDPLAVVDSTIL